MLEIALGNAVFGKVGYDVVGPQKIKIGHDCLAALDAYAKQSRGSLIMPVKALAATVSGLAK
jgi:hypothetical protein